MGDVACCFSSKDFSGKRVKDNSTQQPTYRTRCWSVLGHSIGLIEKNLPTFLFLAIPLLRAGKQSVGHEQKYSREINAEVLSVGSGTETGNLRGGS